jgi:multiple sugar transport system permease protein
LPNRSNSLIHERQVLTPQRIERIGHIEFIRGIPRELDQVARIDGCGHFGICPRIILPLTVPALARTAAFTLINTWNGLLRRPADLFDATTVVHSAPIALLQFTNASSASPLGPLFAISMLSLLPVLGFFAASQRLLTQGIVSTGFR